jgi:hypothetical protein
MGITSSLVDRDHPFLGWIEACDGARFLAMYFSGSVELDWIASLAFCTANRSVFHAQSSPSAQSEPVSLGTIQLCTAGRAFSCYPARDVGWTEPE